MVREPDVARLFREVVEQEMIGRLADRLGGAGAGRRAALATSQIAGLVFTRYVIRLEPLASMSIDGIVQRVAPALRMAFNSRRQPSAVVQRAR